MDITKPVVRYRNDHSSITKYTKKKTLSKGYATVNYFNSALSAFSFDVVGTLKFEISAKTHGQCH